MILVAWPVAAQSQATPERAAEIRQAVAGWLGDRAEIVVTPAGDLYAMTIRATGLAVLGDLQLSFDAIFVALEPLADGGLAATWSLPDEIAVDGPDGTSLIAIGASLGHWEIGSPIDPGSGDIALDDLTLSNPEGEVVWAVAGMTLTWDGETDAAGLLDLAGTMIVDQLSVLDDAGGAQAELVAADFAVHDLKVDGYQLLLDTFAGGSEIIPLDGLSLLLRLGDVAVDVGELRLALEDGGFDLGIEGLSGDTARLSIASDVGDLDMAPLPPGPLAAFMPDTAAIDLAMTKLPAAELRALLLDLLHKRPRLGGLLQAFLQSTGTLEIRDLGATGANGGVDMVGTAWPNPQSPLGAAAQISIMVTGLDEAAVLLRGDRSARATARLLERLKAVGWDTTSGGPRSIRLFAIELTPSGQLLVNNTDMGQALDVLTD